MIQFLCPKCKNRLRVPLEAAGRVGKCKQCDSKVRIPTPKKTTGQVNPQPANEQLTSPSRGAQGERKKKPITRTNPWDALLNQIREEFDGKVPRNPMNFPYQLSLMLVAAMMILLPLLYVGLIIGACFGMHWYWTDVLTSGISKLPSGRGGVFGLLALISPLLGGCVMIVFMVKPLFFVFAKPPEPRRRSIKRGTEPALFELVDRICESTGSPKPKRIDIDNEVNASASFRRGMLSLLGKDLVLTIGAPLLAGMNTRQLTGVLAHEFGHFAQGGGMKTTYLIRSINHWFARVVYQRDQLDQMLDDAITQSDFRISLILMVAKLFVFVSRSVLWCFMVAAHVISCLMMRQMEYDADRYEAHVAGSEQFADTSKRLTVLAAGQEGMYEQVSKGLSENLLLDDLPGITTRCARGVSTAERQRIEKLSDAASGSLFSTHPTNQKRIEAAKKHKAEGLFRIEHPARELIKNYDAICSGVSVDFYRNHLGILADPNKLHRSEELSGKT